MERTRIKRYPLTMVLFTAMVILAGLYSGHAKANSSNQLPGTQLAFFIGYHSYGGHIRPAYVYYGPRKRARGVYWTGWRFSGNGCRNTCLVDRWTGRAIRCKKRCM